MAQASLMPRSSAAMRYTLERSLMYSAVRKVMELITVRFTGSLPRMNTG